MMNTMFLGIVSVEAFEPYPSRAIDLVLTQSSFRFFSSFIFPGVLGKKKVLLLYCYLFYAKI